VVRGTVRLGSAESAARNAAQEREEYRLLHKLVYSLDGWIQSIWVGRPDGVFLREEVVSFVRR
jgi:hypothetical protein